MMRMKSGLLGSFLLLLLLLLLILSSTVPGLGSVVSKQYSYIQSHSTWQDAQRYCRSSTYYSDLATIYTESDEDLITMRSYHAWIGLYKDTSTISTLWSWTYRGIYFFNWADREPDYHESCATVYYTNIKFYGHSCGGSFFFFCHERRTKDFKYTFIPQSKSWSEAQTYCRQEYHDLATFEETRSLKSAVDEQNFPVWTGLHRDGSTWKWSTGLSDYRNWENGEPGNNGNCVSISSSKKEMATQDCSARFPFVCFRDNLVLVKENKTWEEALEHCRTLVIPQQSHLRYELVSVQPGEDHKYVMNKVMEADTEEVWAGLRFLAGNWLWVNRASVSYPDLPLCPPEGQHCGALSKKDKGSMEITDCSEKRNFLCYSF